MERQSPDVSVIGQLLRELGLSASLLSPLISHASAVAHHADRLGLVTERSVEAVIARHTADSLLFALARAPEQGERWVDVGSGAGFPGLVLACCYAQAGFTLVEPQTRRAGFLEAECARLGLDNVDVVIARAADLAPEFDVATARALADPAIALETLHRLADRVLVAVGGRVPTPAGVDDIDVRRANVDSPGRIFMIAPRRGGA
ncbi:MAG: 16S rRNA (guanine(527)-N(7))-methyltransferase RsmG [Actinomycetota bacterium]